MKKIAVSLVLASAMALAACDGDTIPTAPETPGDDGSSDCQPGSGECQQEQ